MVYRFALALTIFVTPAWANGSMGREVNVIEVPTHHRVLKDFAKARKAEAKAKAKESKAQAKSQAKAREKATKAYRKKWKLD